MTLSRRLQSRWRKFEKCLPLRGKWLVWAAVGLLAVFWLVGLQLGWDRWHYRVYFVSSANHQYYWHPAPGQGVDCAHYMLSTGSGEVARSVRLGDLVFEVSQDEMIGLERSALNGPDCH